VCLQSMGKVEIAVKQQDGFQRDDKVPVAEDDESIAPTDTTIMSPAKEMGWGEINWCGTVPSSEWVANVRWRVGR